MNRMIFILFILIWRAKYFRESASLPSIVDLNWFADFTFADINCCYLERKQIVK